MSLRSSRLLTLAALLAVGSTPVLAQHEHGETEKAKMDHGAMHGAPAWKEMDAFHRLLGATYHPVAERQNLAPLRASADSLASAATTWAASPVPPRCGGSALSEDISAIAKDAQSLATSVRAASSSEVLTAAITALHDRFEAVEKRCGGHGAKAGMKH